MPTRCLLPMPAHRMGNGYESLLKLISIFRERHRNIFSEECINNSQHVNRIQKYKTFILRYTVEWFRNLYLCIPFYTKYLSKQSKKFSLNSKQNQDLSITMKTVFLLHCNQGNNYITACIQ